MLIIKDALPLERAEALREAFIKAHYKKYSHREKSLVYPDEEYECSYTRSPSLEKSELFKQTVRVLASTYLTEFGTTAVCHAYRMLPGDLFRTHDDRKNGIGFIYYLSKGWLWDWGGLLCVEKGDRISALKPTFNHLAIIEDFARHFVSPVTQYAKEPRYAVVGFAK